jgi:hypothetical protein
VSTYPTFNALPVTTIGYTRILTAYGRTVQDALEADGFNGTQAEALSLITTICNVWERHEGVFEIYLAEGNTATIRVDNDTTKPISENGVGLATLQLAMLYNERAAAVLGYLSLLEKTA